MASRARRRYAYVLWSDPVEKLFDALSYCAGLHPSSVDANSNGGNPFSSIAPFGSGVSAAKEGDEDEEDLDEEDQVPEKKRVRTELETPRHSA